MSTTRPLTLWHAHLDTRHYTFDAYGATREEAQRVLQGVLREHAKQCGVSGTTLWTDYADSVHYLHVTVGCGYRDHDDAPLYAAKRNVV